MSPDTEKYRRHLDGHALADADKDELIRYLWLIMESFVDRAFDLNRPPLRKDETTPSLVIEFEAKSSAHYGYADDLPAPENESPVRGQST